MKKSVSRFIAHRKSIQRGPGPGRGEVATALRNLRKKHGAKYRERSFSKFR